LIEPPPFQRTIAAVSYAPPWNWLIHEFKFRNALDLADSLATLLLQAQSLQADTLPSLMVPMPLNAARLRERGYNQSWELARRCAPRLGCQTDSALLIRIKDTSRQASLSREQRASNMRGVFAVEPTRRAEIRGRSITLVDDVMTTQATADEAARTLMAAGALSVDVWVVARTPSPTAR
jgi:ComF family protein